MTTFSNEVHREKDTLFQGNSMTVAEFEPLTIQSGVLSSNHYATPPVIGIVCLVSQTCSLVIVK